ncbi:MAG: hypothetical protein A2511_08150 [Deltaproteobacteria bacterium RIFOXYD12_FULL_50_9]|nr:MAG: hypothetical protein A2511_08150 [Deltaproteobacteria bacterium RIFOXYD12_FULL_50_9]
MLKMLRPQDSEKGFTLIELMIVVAIIGILAAVAIPAYMNYIQKARVTSLVFPGMHSLQTNLGLYYSTHQRFPQAAATVGLMDDEADMTYMDSVSMRVNGFAFSITSVVGEKLEKLNNYRMTAVAQTSGNDGKIARWSLGGNLAEKLGLSGEN